MDLCLQDEAENKDQQAINQDDTMNLNVSIMEDVKGSFKSNSIMANEPEVTINFEVVTMDLTNDVDKPIVDEGSEDKAAVNIVDHDVPNLVFIMEHNVLAF